MKVTEESAVEALRCAMQVVVDAWGGASLSAEAPSPDAHVNRQRQVLRALALVSRWTCVQWGCAAGWWGDVESELPQLRRIGLSRLSRWDLETGNPCDGTLDAASFDGAIGDSAVVDRVWHWVSVACERLRQQLDSALKAEHRFERVVTAFEHALQIVPDVQGDSVVLRFGKANTAHTRRKSGSYYTPNRIVDLVLDQTLERALDEHPPQSGEFGNPLRVLDPACGAGLFLVSAATRITARRLASRDVALRDAAYATSFAQTVRENIFGVDLNPLAIEWCRVWLWSSAGDRSLDIDTFAPGLRVGNALVGAPHDYWRGSPSAAWKPTVKDDKAETRRLRAKHELELAANRLTSEPDFDAQRRRFADGWCDAFFWSKVSASSWGGGGGGAPTYGALCEAAASETSAAVPPRRYFHWSLEFRSVFADGGFDVVVGNPPWIAHAGRAAQSLEPHLKHYLSTTYSSFNGYPSTHGLFVERAATLLKAGGRLGFVLPASVSELGGYEATRVAHDRLCDFEADLIDFGEGCFPGVTQPCMGLVSRRHEGGRTVGAWGAPWPMLREDLGELAAALLARLAGLPVLDPGLFGERGIQSDQRMKEHLSSGSEPHGRFTTPVREGADIREFFLGPPKLWADWPALGRQARAVEEFQLVQLVVRQTASFPIATLYDGLPFRNSLLAGFGSERWEPPVLVALLNSSLVRWHHFMRHRDARQPVLPQVKIGHLRAVPGPPLVTPEHKQELARLAQCSGGLSETIERERAELDRLVGDMYELTDAERELVQEWAEPLLSKARRRPSVTLPVEG